jgi:hypothetical protein
LPIARQPTASFEYWAARTSLERHLIEERVHAEIVGLSPVYPSVLVEMKYQKS